MRRMARLPIGTTSLNSNNGRCTRHTGCGSNSRAPEKLCLAVLIAVNQHFRWQAEPVGNNTSSPSRKFNLAFASGGGTPRRDGPFLSAIGNLTRRQLTSTVANRHGASCSKGLHSIVSVSHTRLWLPGECEGPGQRPSKVPRTPNIGRGSYLVSGGGISAGQSKVRQRAKDLYRHDVRIIEDLVELGGGFLSR